jgi:GT2 family glycosyltransferase
MNAPSVSIVIPSLNAPLIDDTVKSLFAQDAAEVITEVLVVGRDERNVLTPHPRVTFVDTKVPVSAPRARNLGIQQARSDMLVFIDADCLATPGWLSHLLLAAQVHPVVGGSVHFESDSYWAATYNISMFHEFLPSRPPGFRPHLPTLNLLVQRSVIADVGLFDETLARGQDTDWTARMTERGYQLYFEPGAAVIHQHERRSARSVLRLWRQSGAYSVRIRRRHPHVLSSSRLFDHPRLLMLLSPLIALLNSARLFARDRALWRYAAAFPAIYLTKVAWCIGAASVGREHGIPK